MEITEGKLWEAADHFWTASALTLTRMTRMLLLFSPSDRKKIEREFNELSLVGIAVPPNHEEHSCCAHAFEWQLKNNFIIPEAMFGNTDEASPVWGQFRISWRHFGGEMTFDVGAYDRVAYFKQGYVGWIKKTRSGFAEEIQKHAFRDTIVRFFTDATSQLPQLEKLFISLCIRFFSAGSNFDFPFFINRVQELLQSEQETYDKKDRLEAVTLLTAAIA